MSPQQRPAILQRLSAFLALVVSMQSGVCAKLPRAPALQAEYSDWYESSEWHESYRVEPGRGAMWRHWTTEQDPLAVCNDGSPGVVYVRHGQGQGLNRWLIRFQGAQYCWDAESCRTRENSNHSHFLTTSNFAPEWISNTLPQDPHVFPWMLKAFGVLNVDPIMNPLWHSWNHVYLFPCSSDAFLGDAPATAELPWHFRGRRCLFAAFQLLLEKFHLTEASDVLLVGDSTGGAGMLQVVDDIKDLVMPQAPSIKRFKAWVDGGWMYPAQQPDGGEFFFSPGHLALFQQNANAAFHRRCSEQFPESPWQCFYAANIWPHVETPVLFHHCLYDFHLRLYLLMEEGPLANDPSEWERIRESYISSYRSHDQSGLPERHTYRMLLQHLAPGAQLPNLFSPACTFHQMSDADWLVASSHIGEHLFLEVFKDWYLDEEPDVFMVDPHPGARDFEPMSNQEQWDQRYHRYLDFEALRRGQGLPMDITETEPPFLMQPDEGDQLEPGRHLSEPEHHKVHHSAEGLVHSQHRHTRT